MEVEWLGHAGHFISASDCRFRMTTRVGVCLVSTVGELVDSKTGEVREVGCDRLYETMVFLCDYSSCPCECGVPNHNGHELICIPYNKAADARRGHVEMIERVQSGEFDFKRDMTRCEFWGKLEMVSDSISHLHYPNPGWVEVLNDCGVS
jgi:hypothetical protein